MRRRIVVSTVVVTAIAVIVFAVPLGFVLADLYREEEVVRLERAAGEAGEHVPVRFPAGSEPITLRKERGEPRIGVYGRNGRRIVGFGPSTGDAAVRSALRGEARDDQYGGRLIVAVPLTRGERVVGALRASTPTSTVGNRTIDAILVMIAIGIGAVGISALIAIYLSRRLTRPIDRLAHTAALLGDGDFTVRSERSGIPEVDQVSTALDTTAERLDEMLTRERSFSSAASHQLRTPLTGLRLNLESARLSPNGGRDAKLDAALGEVDRLERTIDDLLVLAREVPTERTEVDVTELVARLRDDWRGRLAASGRPLRVVVEPGLPRVTASNRALGQILDVLLDNALRHGAGTVTIRARSAGTGVAVEVTDEGAGIPGDPRRIFERRARSAAGHGMGLALASSLADAEGARLVLEHAGAGPVFALFLTETADLDM